MDGNRAEAERWLTIAEKLLASRDLHGTRTFAIRVRDFHPHLADQILAVSDTLLAAQSNPNDWYRILQLPPTTQSMDAVATQYRKLALLLNPGRNNLSFADQALRIVSDAWSVLSNPSKKAAYDNELRAAQRHSTQLMSHEVGWMSQLTQQQPQPAPPHLLQQQPQQSRLRESEQQLRPPQPPQLQQQLRSPSSSNQKGTQPPLVRRSPRKKNGQVAAEVERPISNDQAGSTWNMVPPPGRQKSSRTLPNLQRQSTRETQATGSTRRGYAESESQVLSFWTACPYCYVLYEYPKVYEECCLRCQNCERAFHAAVIPSPPLTGKNTYFCCWGFFPIGFSENANKTRSNVANWSPISPMFSVPGQGGATQGNNKNPGKEKKSSPSVFFDEHDVYVDISSSSEGSEEEDDEWEDERRKKKAKTVKGRGGTAKKFQGDRVRKGNKMNTSEHGNSGCPLPDGVPIDELSGKVVGYGGRKQMGRGSKDYGKLDLNVELSNEVEEPSPRRGEGIGTGYGEEDNIEGNGFFEGLDEFLSSLPILSVVSNDKVKAT